MKIFGLTLLLCVTLFCLLINRTENKAVLDSDSDDVKILFEFVEETPLERFASNLRKQHRVKRGLFWSSAAQAVIAVGTGVANLPNIIDAFTSGTNKGIEGFTKMGDGFGLFFNQFNQLRLGKKRK